MVKELCHATCSKIVVNFFLLEYAAISEFRRVDGILPCETKFKVNY